MHLCRCGDEILDNMEHCRECERKFFLYSFARVSEPYWLETSRASYRLITPRKKQLNCISDHRCQLNLET